MELSDNNSQVISALIFTATFFFLFFPMRRCLKADVNEKEQMDAGVITANTNTNTLTRIYIIKKKSGDHNDQDVLLLKALSFSLRASADRTTGCILFSFSCAFRTVFV